MSRKPEKPISPMLFGSVEAAEIELGRVVGDPADGAVLDEVEIDRIA